MIKRSRQQVPARWFRTGAPSRATDERITAPSGSRNGSAATGTVTPESSNLTNEPAETALKPGPQADVQMFWLAVRGANVDAGCGVAAGPMVTEVP